MFKKSKIAEYMTDSEYEKALEGFKKSPRHDRFRYKLDKWYDRMSYRYYKVIMFIMKYLRKSSIWINMKSRFALDSDMREWWAMHLMGITDEMLTNAKTGDLEMLYEIIEWELGDRGVQEHGSRWWAMQINTNAKTDMWDTHE